jgi:V/A-type H+-transporting ATPase subunit A
LLVVTVYLQGRRLLDLGVPVEQITRLPIMGQIRRLKSTYSSDQSDQMGQLREFKSEIRRAFDPIRMEYSAVEEKTA